ncbi:MAG: hypothetical protein GF418_06965 [Chitinivibrionales bacterium]|nr:hypothetical protein [Chitinivibrionales bacterium]MBD3395351.1 hypothetical protein [Chitinivibrionales bacterium]
MPLNSTATTSAPKRWQHRLTGGFPRRHHHRKKSISTALKRYCGWLVRKRRRRSRISTFVRKRKHDAIYIVVRMLVAFAGRMPRAAGLALFGRLGQIVALLSPGDRKVAGENLRRVFGGAWSEKQIRRFIMRVYRELGKNVFDTLYLARCPREELLGIVKDTGFDRFEAAFREGKGAIALTAHLGCFESLLHLFPRRGFASFAVGRRLFDRRIDRIVTGLRSGEDIDYVYRNESPRKILGLLKEGRTMGVLIDQDTNVEGVFARFLGAVAHTPSGPMRMAMRYGIPAFVVTIARQPDNTHLASITGPLELDDTGEPERDLVTNVEKANARISEAILKNPDQWVWMHRRWRKRPSDPGCRHVPNIEAYETVA